MAARIGDTHRLERAMGLDALPAVPYASRGAGLYSEVRCDPTDSLRAHVARTGDKDGGPPPASPAWNA